MIRYVPSNRSPILFMDEERLPRADLYIAPETYKRRQELMRERFEHMLAYAANETRLPQRRAGSGISVRATPAPCGVCDICLGTQTCRGSGQAQGCATPSADGGPARKAAANGYPAAQPTRTNWPRNSPGRHERLGRALRELLDEGIAGTGRDGKIGLKSGRDRPRGCKKSPRMPFSGNNSLFL